jgi:hypothetical protein
LICPQHLLRISLPLNAAYDHGRMAKQNEHGRLIAAAAKAALAPIGCKRVRQSRFWYSDEGFWTVSIEFQPSGWAKGTYLNVGANWLWYPKSGWGFSEDARVENIGFIKFENAEQFTPLILDMATRAAQEVLMRREKYKSLADIYRHLLPRAARNGAPVYHAAVAAGLAGDLAISRQLLLRLENWETAGQDWTEEIKANGAALARFVDDPVTFRSAVLAIIAEVRNRLHLLPNPQPFRTMGSKVAT